MKVSEPLVVTTRFLTKFCIYTLNESSGCLFQAPNQVPNLNLIKFMKNEGGDINNNNKQVLVAQGGPKTANSARRRHTRGQEFRRPSTKMLREKTVVHQTRTLNTIFRGSSHHPE